MVWKAVARAALAMTPCWKPGRAEATWRSREERAIEAMICVCCAVGRQSIGPAALLLGDECVGFGICSTAWYESDNDDDEDGTTAEARENGCRSGALLIPR